MHQSYQYIHFIIYTNKSVFKLFILDWFLSFDQLVFLDELYRITLGLLIFLRILAILQHLSFNYQLHVMHNTIKHALGGVASCVLLLGLAIAAFASLQYMYLGKRIHEYRNMYSSMLSLLTAILSLAKLSTTSEEATGFDYLIFVLFCLIVNFLLLNLLISLLNETMSSIKEGKINRMALTKFDKNMSEHVFRKMKNIFVLCRRSHEDKGTSDC